MVTMTDIARRAGVSVTTVSHVLNETRRVSDPLREAVMCAVLETGYVPNHLARALRTARTLTIGLAMPAISNPYLGELVRSFQSEAEGHGYRLLISDTHDDPGHEERAVRDLCDRQVDGILLTPSADPGVSLAHLAQREMPVTLVDRLSDSAYDQVGSENTHSTAALVRHLADHGHQRVAFVSGLRGLVTSTERLEGYRRGVQLAGLDDGPGLVVDGSSDDVHARDQVLRLFRSPDPPTGLVVSNNHMMIGAVRAMREIGLEAPADVALVGFDDFEWADLFSPRLTVMAQPWKEIGREAVRMLLSRLGSPEGPRRTVRLDPVLVVRNSCGCPS